MAFLVILAVLVFIVLVLVSRIRIVPQANVYVVERLGAFYKAWGTGIHFLVPFIDRVAKRVSIKEQVVDFKPQAVITKDNVTMQLINGVFTIICNALYCTLSVRRKHTLVYNHWCFFAARGASPDCADGRRHGDDRRPVRQDRHAQNDDRRDD